MHSFVSGYLGVYFHGKEKPEAWMWSQVVQLLFQLHQPLRSKMYILKKHPATGLARRVNGLLCL